MIKLMQYKPLSASHQPALEMIDFQKDSYARDVEFLFAKISRDLLDGSVARTRIKSHPSIKAIQDLTFERMGLKIEIITNAILAACLPFYPNPYSAIVPGRYGERGTHFEHPLLKPILKKQIELLDRVAEHKGTVDTKGCRVSGFFSEYVNPIFINFSVLSKMKMTAAEITAVFLHELGHCFTAFEYSNRLNTTNQVLAQVLKDTLSKDKVDKSYVFKELKKINPKTTDKEIEKILDGKNLILGRATMKYIEEVITSQLPVNHYDESGNETLADNFVARWGYGPHVVLALDKLGYGSKWNPENTWFASTINSLTSLFSVFGMVRLLIKVFQIIQTLLGGATIASSLSLFGLSIWFLYLFIGFVLSHSTYVKEMTYDDTKNRYKRVRNQLVEMLKEVTLFSNEQTKDIIDQIQMLDDVIEGRGKYKNIVTLFIDFLTPGGDNINDDLKMQRLLEGLSANELYIRAASIRTSAA